MITALLGPMAPLHRILVYREGYSTQVHYQSAKYYHFNWFRLSNNCTLDLEIIVYPVIIISIPMIH